MNKPAHSVLPSPSERAALSAEALAGTLRVARVLAQSDRKIDLAGLDQDVGRLCAAVLDLPPAEGRFLRPQLALLLAELDGLSHCMGALAEGSE